MWFERLLMLAISKATPLISAIHAVRVTRWLRHIMLFISYSCQNRHNTHAHDLYEMFAVALISNWIDFPYKWHGMRVENCEIETVSNHHPLECIETYLARIKTTFLWEGIMQAQMQPYCRMIATAKSDTRNPAIQFKPSKAMKYWTQLWAVSHWFSSYTICPKYSRWYFKFLVEFRIACLLTHIIKYI